MTTQSTTDDRTEALLVEQARAMIRDLLSGANAAKDGEVLAAIEGFLLSRGRDFLRHAAQVAAAAQAEAVEKKGRRPGPVRAAVAATTKAAQPTTC